MVASAARRANSEVLEVGVHGVSTGTLGFRLPARTLRGMAVSVVPRARMAVTRDLVLGQVLRLHRHRQKYPGRPQHGVGRPHRRAGRMAGSPPLVSTLRRSHLISCVS